MQDGGDFASGRSPVGGKQPSGTKHEGI
jgi:hypothetical protein